MRSKQFRLSDLAFVREHANANADRQARDTNGHPNHHTTNPNPSLFTGDNRPVEQVSWGDCQDFCTALSQLSGLTIRLPTEAEWEYTCRAGSTTRYSFGDDTADIGNYAWFGEDLDTGQTHDVADKLPSPWNLYDMHGNVREWCNDWYDATYYFGRPNPDIDPGGPALGSVRVVRGAPYYGGAGDGRSALRSNGAGHLSHNGLGFRVAAGTQ